MNSLIVAAGAFLGGLVAGVLGWMKSGKPWNTKTFGQSIAMAFISAIGFGLAYSTTEAIGVKTVLAAILAGAGVDNLANRALGLLPEKK